jgi:CubicO group peptidase (beta-lactamase class C family)
VFTGILLAEMSLRGEVALDDPIGRYVPAEVAAGMPAPERQPNLADLSAHTSGLPRIPLKWLRRLRGTNDPYSHLAERDVWAVLGPGTVRPRRRRPRYSNYGVGLLGHLLSRAAGTSYKELVHERILAPLRLDSTDFAPGGVVPGFRRRTPTPPWTFGALHAAGALRSTAADMIAFAAACIDPPEDTLGEALHLARRRIRGGRFRGLGLGWQLRQAPPGRPPDATVWHNGGTYGGASFLAVDPDHRIAVAAFGNRGPGLTSPLDRASWKLFDDIRRHAADQRG